ncbi:unnamed protein product, partial [Prorocentrum cordatum]
WALVAEAEAAASEGLAAGWAANAAAAEEAALGGPAAGWGAVAADAAEAAESPEGLEDVHLDGLTADAVRPLTASAARRKAH